MCPWLLVTKVSETCTRYASGHCDFSEPARSQICVFRITKHLVSRPLSRLTTQWALVVTPRYQPRGHFTLLTTMWHAVSQVYAAQCIIGTEEQIHTREQCLFVLVSTCYLTSKRMSFSCPPRCLCRSSSATGSDKLNWFTWEHWESCIVVLTGLMTLCIRHVMVGLSELR